MDYVPVKTRGDRDFMLWLLSNLHPVETIHIPLGKYLEWVREEWRGDKAFMLKTMLTQSGHEFLEWASDELKDDDEVVHAALQHHKPLSDDYPLQYGDALQHASARLRNDDTTVLLACKDVGADDTESHHPFRYASNELQSSRSFVSKVAQCSAPEVGVRNFEIDTLSSDGVRAVRFIEFVTNELREDRAFLLQVGLELIMIL